MIIIGSAVGTKAIGLDDAADLGKNSNSVARAR
jgi:hypothetical protein